ncbi:MAG: AAA family ATPase [Erysipelotrichaceae bacterium]|nr:AAA family ATPase [Erysipelotrichaceae bacterium]
MENQTDIDNLELIDEDQNEEVLEDETKENNMFDTVIDVIDNEDNLDNDEIIETISNDDTTKEEINKTNQEENSVQEENNTNEENQEEQDSSNDSKDIKNSPYYKVLLEYGEDITDKEYITNPAIGREKEIQELIVILLTPEKSGILVGKPGIGKTAIVEGLSYRIQNGNIPDALKNYTILKLSSASLTGIIPDTQELRIQHVVDNLKNLDRVMVFIDEIHTLIGNGENTLDFANIFKPVIDRGTIKIIGATTSDEYDRYILRDKAFVRRFQKVEVSEPTREMNIQIMMGTYPKFEKKMGLKLKYTDFVKQNIMAFITDITSEFKRTYETSVRYPDISLTILQQAFSYAAFDNRQEVDIRDVRKAILNTKLIYPDVIKKELVRFNEVFRDIYLMETKQILKDET